MKKLLTLLLAGVLLFVSSCKDDDENSISPDEAAALIAAAVGDNSGGAVSYVGTTVDVASNDNQLKSTNTEITLVDSSYTDSGTFTSNTDGVIGDWNYFWSFTHILEYASGIAPIYPVKIKTDFTYNGAVDLPRFSSSHNGSGELSYTELAANAQGSNFVLDSLWLFNGTFVKEATFINKVNQKTITSKTTLNFDDCQVYTDGSKKIKTGFARVTIKGEVPNKGEFEYNATLTFGIPIKGQGVLEINGNIYTFSVESGEIVK